WDLPGWTASSRMPDGSCSGQYAIGYTALQCSEGGAEQDRVQEHAVQSAPPSPEHRLLLEQHHVSTSLRLHHDRRRTAEQPLGVVRPRESCAVDVTFLREHCHV